MSGWQLICSNMSKTTWRRHALVIQSLIMCSIKILCDQNYYLVLDGIQIGDAAVKGSVHDSVHGEWFSFVGDLMCSWFSSVHGDWFSSIGDLMCSCMVQSVLVQFMILFMVLQVKTAHDNTDIELLFLQSHIILEEEKELAKLRQESLDANCRNYLHF